MFSEKDLELWLEFDSFPISQATVATQKTTFDIAMMILSSLKLGQSDAINHAKKSIAFDKLLQQNFSENQRILIELAANLYDSNKFKTDFVNKLTILNRQDLKIVFSALNNRF